MATAVEMSSSFVYKDLVSHVKEIQKQIIEIDKILDDQFKNKKIMHNELNSRRLTFIDPYGNHMTEQYMDHESIDKLAKQLKKNYVPKFLKNWIKIGTISQNGILPLTDCDLKSTVSNYTDAHQFIAYGGVTLWIETYENSLRQRFSLRVLLTDNTEKIKLRIKEEHGFDNVELKVTESNEINWHEGIILNLNDTIMSSRLYENHGRIMAKIIKQTVNYCLLFILLDFVFFKEYFYTFQ